MSYNNYNTYNTHNTILRVLCFILPGVPAEASLLSWQNLQGSHAKLLEEKRQAAAELSGDTLSAVREPGVAEEMYRSTVLCRVSVASFGLDSFIWSQTHKIFTFLSMPASQKLCSKWRDMWRYRLHLNIASYCRYNADSSIHTVHSDLCVFIIFLWFVMLSIYAIISPLPFLFHHISNPIAHLLWALFCVFVFYIWILSWDCAFVCRSWCRFFINMFMSFFRNEFIVHSGENSKEKRFNACWTKDTCK